MDSWNDERMDELSGRVDSGFKEMREGFARVDREMKEGFAEINRKLDQIPTREEIDHRLEAVEGRVDRVSNRLEHMLWGLFAVGGGLLANLLAGHYLG